MYTPFDLKIGNDRAEIGISTPLPDSVDGALNLNASFVNGHQTVRHRESAIVVDVDSKRRLGESFVDRSDGLAQLV